MKRLAVFLCAMLVACGVTLNSPAVINDGNLAVASLKLLEADAKMVGAPAADLAIIGLTSTAVQAALADLRKGLKTPSDFAQLVNDQISQLAPALLRDFKADETIRTGVVLLQQLLPLIAADVTNKMPTAAMGPHQDPRQELQNWMDRHKR